MKRRRSYSKKSSYAKRPAVNVGMSKKKKKIKRFKRNVRRLGSYVNKNVRLAYAGAMSGLRTPFVSSHVGRNNVTASDRYLYGPATALGLAAAGSFGARAANKFLGPASLGFSSNPLKTVGKAVGGKVFDYVSPHLSHLYDRFGNMVPMAPEPHLTAMSNALVPYGSNIAARVAGNLPTRGSLNILYDYGQAAYTKASDAVSELSPAVSAAAAAAAAALGHFYQLSGQDLTSMGGLIGGHSGL